MRLQNTFRAKLSLSRSKHVPFMYALYNCVQSIVLINCVAMMYTCKNEFGREIVQESICAFVSCIFLSMYICIEKKRFKKFEINIVKRN